MDKTLAEIYGTNQSDDDQEKLAAAAAAEELTEDGAIDLEGMTEEDLEAVAAEVLEASSDEEETEEVEEPAEEAEKTAEEATEEADEEMQEKVAEADQMGRIMAHAYVQELRAIEKTAKFDPADLKKVPFKHKITGAARAAGKWVAGKAGEAKKGGKRYGELMAGGQKELVSGKRPGNALKVHAKGSAHRSEQLKSLGARAGTAAGAGAGAAGAVGAKKAFGKKEKKASAFETLAEQRAQEILAANGVTEQPETETTKYDVLADAVEQRATEMLTEAGYEFEAAEE